MKNAAGRSVFFKLLIVYGFAFLVILVGALVTQLLSASATNIEVSLRNVRHYTSLLVAEMGSPPDPAIAERITRGTGLDIAIVGPGLSWSSSRELLEQANFRDDDAADAMADFREFHERFFIVNQGGYRYFFKELHADQRYSLFLLVLMSITVVAALAISYILVRRLLQPIRTMTRVAQEFGVSDWKERVRPKGQDEFATLGRTLDSMADRIEIYIASMHELLIAISHELRSPLTRMKVALEFIDNETIKTSLNEEIDALDRLTGSLLEQKRLATQGGGLHRESLDMTDWLRQACAPYQAKAAFKLALPPGQLPAAIDATQMGLALRNLVENALRHAPGSPIFISLAANSTKDRSFSLEICDEGPGMPADLMARVGQPFLLANASRTGSRAGGGFGLGLSIVVAIVTAHGGSFHVHNRQPRGFSAIIEI